MKVLVSLAMLAGLLFGALAITPQELEPGTYVKWSEDKQDRTWRIIKRFDHERPFADIRCEEIDKEIPSDVRIYADLASLTPQP